MIWPLLGCLQYIKGQVERCPSTQRLHWQLYLETARACQLREALEVLDLPGAHLSPARNIAAAKDYVFKEETREPGWDRLEEGTPSIAGDKNPGLSELILAAQAGAGQRELATSMPVAYARFATALGRWRSAMVTPRSTAPKVYVFLGDSGSGKSSWIREQLVPAAGLTADDVYNRPQGCWWTESVIGKKLTIVEDFAGSSEDGTLTSWLTATDRYAAEVPVKGGFVSLSDMIICFTATTEPKDWFPHVSNWRSKRITEFARRVTQTIIMPPSVAPDDSGDTRDKTRPPQILQRRDGEKWLQYWGVHDSSIDFTDGVARWVSGR